MHHLRRYHYLWKAWQLFLKSCRNGKKREKDDSVYVI
jgi:hypothetical protein